MPASRILEGSLPERHPKGPDLFWRPTTTQNGVRAGYQGRSPCLVSRGLAEPRKSFGATMTCSQIQKFVVFSVKNVLQSGHFLEVTPEEYAEGVIELSPGWSEAQPWVLIVVCDPLLRNLNGEQRH